MGGKGRAMYGWVVRGGAVYGCVVKGVLWACAYIHKVLEMEE